MQKRYELDKGHYILGLVLPTLLFLLIAIYTAALVALQRQTALTNSVLLVTIILFLDHFVALSHPNVVSIDHGDITLSCYGREHIYPKESIERINVRPVSNNRRIYLRINQAGLFRGRYWLHLDKMKDGKELRAFLEQLVDEKHPDMKSIRTKSFTRTK